MYEKLAMDCRTLSRINVMFSNKAETYHDHKKQLFKMAASRKSESKIIDLRISFWSHRFLYKTMEFKPPSNTESKSNCYNSGGFQWISTSCWRRSVHNPRERTSSKLPHHHLLAYLAYLSKRNVFSLVIPLSFVSPILDSFDLNWFRVLDKDIGWT